MERPERLMAVYLNLIDKQLLNQLVKIDSEYAEESDLLLCHSEKHIAAIKRCSEDKKKGEPLKHG